MNMKDFASHGIFDDIVAMAGDTMRPICLRLRAVVVSMRKEACEIVWPKHRIASYGVGPKKMTEHYAYIGVQKSHVNLESWAKRNRLEYLKNSVTRANKLT